MHFQFFVFSWLSDRYSLPAGSFCMSWRVALVECDIFLLFVGQRSSFARYSLLSYLPPCVVLFDSRFLLSWTPPLPRASPSLLQFLRTAPRRHLPRFIVRLLSELRACETLWSARELASVALSAERKRHTENVFHMLLSSSRLFFSGALFLL